MVHLTDLGIDMGKSKKEKKLEQRAKEAQEFEGKTEKEIANIKAERVKAQESEPKYELNKEDRTELLGYINEEELGQIEQLFYTGNHMETKQLLTTRKRGENCISYCVKLSKVSWKVQRLLKTHLKLSLPKQR